ncbi:MAG: hypothetical protein WDN03_07410 [Rhizomicrobium sp.]
MQAANDTLRIGERENGLASGAKIVEDNIVYLGNAADMQTVTAFCAVAISVMSLVVSVAALLIQQRHDRKSVQPIPQITLGDYEDNLHIAIENAGVGPLIIRKLTVEDAISKEIKSSLIAYMPSLPPEIFWTTFMGKMKERALSPQGKIVLLRLDRPKNNAVKQPSSHFEGFWNDVRSSLGHLTVVLETTDIYGTKLPECRRSLDWFHRLLINDYDGV